MSKQRPLRWPAVGRGWGTRVEPQRQRAAQVSGPAGRVRPHIPRACTGPKSSLTHAPSLMLPGVLSPPQCEDRQSEVLAFPLTQSCLPIAPWGGQASACLGRAMTQHCCPLAPPTTPACSDTFRFGSSSSPTCQLHLGTQQLLCGDLEREEGVGPSSVSVTSGFAACQGPWAEQGGPCSKSL